MANTSLRRIPACQRCHTRKKKCDSKLPSCSNCVKANTECMNFDKILDRTIPRRNLSDVTLSKLADSVKRVSSNGTEPFESDSERSESDKPVKKRLKAMTPLSSTSSTPDHNNFPNEENVLDPMNINAMFSVSDSANSCIEQEFENEINEYADPTTTRGSREVFIANEVIAIARLERDILKAYRKNIVRNLATDLTAYDQLLLLRVCKRYFTWMNSAFPVMHETTTYTRLEKCWNEKASIFEQYQVMMMVAIAMGTISRPHISNSEIGQVSKMFWKAAMKLYNPANRGTESLDNLQNMMLLLQYSLLVPETGNLWQLSGNVMRYATGMSLYTEPNPSQSFDPLTLDLRRRMFWTCYCIDRALSTVTGHPLTVPDSWISAQLPSIYEDKFITADGIIAGPACNLKVAMVLHVGICRLQSEIHARLYGPVVSGSSQVREEDQITWTWKMYDRLRLWKSLFLLPTPLIMKEWMEFQFHMSVVLLLRPLPSRPTPSEEELHVAFHSAGEAMKLVKLMHRDQSAEFPWLTVQNLFMCGLTFINSLSELSSRKPPRPLCISFVDIVLQVQACTSMLETLSTLKAGGDDKMRNVFEVASSNTLHDLAKNFSSHRNITKKCYWEVLAKSDNIRLQRPLEIDGVKVPIETHLDMPAPYAVDDPRLQDFNEEHFYDHDTDAQTVETDRHTGFAFHDNDQTFFQSTMSERDSKNRHSSPMIFGMDGLATISTVASEAEPLVAALSAYSTVADLLAELDRWFLYPM